ncbi:MAG: hypothetical protein ACK553_11645 [Planctomycetota bacterium]
MSRAVITMHDRIASDCPSSDSSDPNRGAARPSAAAEDALARENPLLRSSICLDCRSHRTVVSGKGSVFLLCQSDDTPANWPKYPRQPVRQCPYFASTGAPPESG